jgi:hypothetical protein
LLETSAKIRKNNWLIKIGLVYGVERHFEQYFSNIMTVSFIGGGNQSTWIKPLTCRKLLMFALCNKNSGSGEKNSLPES